MSDGKRVKPDRSTYSRSHLIENGDYLPQVTYGERRVQEFALLLVVVAYNTLNTKRPTSTESIHTYC